MLLVQRYGRGANQCWRERWGKAAAPGAVEVREDSRTLFGWALGRAGPTGRSNRLLESTGWSGVGRPWCSPLARCKKITISNAGFRGEGEKHKQGRAGRERQDRKNSMGGLWVWG